MTVCVFICVCVCSSMYRREIETEIFRERGLLQIHALPPMAVVKIKLNKLTIDCGNTHTFRVYSGSHGSHKTAIKVSSAFPRLELLCLK